MPKSPTQRKKPKTTTAKSGPSSEPTITQPDPVIDPTKTTLRRLPIKKP